MKIKFDITGMSCAMCASRIEKTVLNLNGVHLASVNLLENTLFVNFDENKIRETEIKSAIQNIGYGAEVHLNNQQNSNSSEYARMKNSVVYSFLFAIPLFYVAMGEMLNFPMPSILLKNNLVFSFTQIFLLIPILIINFKYFKNGYKNLYKRSPNMDSLVAIGASAAIVYGIYSLYKILTGEDSFKHSLYFESAGTILAIVTLGKFLEFRAKENTKSAITKLMNLSPQMATILVNDQEIEIKTQDIKAGDIVIVKSGETIPTDGVIVEGKCSIDESMITGESFPVSKRISDGVIGGTINLNGYIKFKATKVGEDSTLFQIIKLVEDANSTKAPIGRIADKISSYFVPTVIGISIITFITWILLGSNIDFALTCAISVLVISCPCALGLATPAAIMVGSGVGAQNGILFKNSEILEKAHLINTVVLDKTGTITKGELSVDEIISFGEMSKNDILKIAIAFENLSKHPISKAILKKAQEEKIEILKPESYEDIEGAGIKGFLGNHEYIVGNKRLIGENDMEFDFVNKEYNYFSNQGKIPVIFCKDKKIEGLIIISDTIKKSSVGAIQTLKNMLIEVIMLTGDNKNAAEYIAKNVGINRVISEVLPQDKEKVITELQEQNKVVLMAGDGINDAPALSRADIGVAIGSGSDIAIESGDIVLVKNNLIDIVNAVKISKATTKNIKQNLFWALFYNSIGIPVAAGCFYFAGLKLNPMIAALAMGFSSVFVVTNALRLRTLKLEKTVIENNKESEGEVIMKKELAIDGMMCMHCANNVKKALSGLNEVENVDVDLENKKAVITMKNPLEDKVLYDLIKDLGYELKSIKDVD